MKGKQLAILLAAVVVLGGVWSLVSGGSWSHGDAGGKVVSFPINEVARLRIKGSDGEVNLVKKSDVWTVQERADYPARFEGISDLLRKLYDLKTVQSLKVGPSQLGRLELAEPGKGSKGGTLLQLTGPDNKPLASLLLGKRYLRKSEGGNPGMEGMDFGGVPAGRYVKPGDGPMVSLVSDSLDTAIAKPENWLVKDFVNVEKATSVVVTGPAEAQRWTVKRDHASSDWTLADAKGDEKLDQAKVGGLNSLFSSTSIADVLAPGTNPAAPLIHATVETDDGFRYEFTLGNEQGINVPVAVKISGNFAKQRVPGKDEKPEDKKRLDDEFAANGKAAEDKFAREKKLESRVYLLARSSVEPLLKYRTDLLAAKPEPPSPAPAATPAIPTVTPGTPALPPTAPGAPSSPEAIPVTPPPAPAAPTPIPAPAAPPAPTAALVPSATPTASPVPAATPVETPAPVPTASEPVTVTTPPMTATPPPVDAVSAPVAAPPVPTPAAPTSTPTPQPSAPPATPLSSPVAATPEPTAAARATPGPGGPSAPPGNR